MKKPNARALAKSFGWFSNALGLTEIVAARKLARIFGFKRPMLLRAFGVREIIAGGGEDARASRRSRDREALSDPRSALFPRPVL